MALDERCSRGLRRVLHRRRSRQRSGVRFARAVPARRDRRELRHAFRAVLREMRHAQKRQVATHLRDLASCRVRIRAVRRGADGDEIVEFADGTVLDLDVRDGEAILRRLERRAAPAVRLRSVEPLLGHLWFRLRLSAATEEGWVMARVRLVEVGGRASGSAH